MADNLARALKDATVKNAKPTDKPQKLTDGGGMFMLVQPNGAKLWRYKFRLHGKEGVHALGAYPDVSLAAARDLHRAARELVAAGINPVHTRKNERAKAAQDAMLAQAGAFENVLAEWSRVTEPNLARLSIKLRTREIKKHLVPAFANRMVDGITRTEVSGLLKRVEARAPEVARNLRNYLCGIFEHAIDVGLLTASPVPPTRILVRRVQVPHAAMAADRLPVFLKTLVACSANPETIAAMRLVILTACRKNEIVCGRWDEIDLDAGEWLIPAERMKARREHWVPLSRQAVAILRDLRRITTGDVLFPGRRDHRQPMADRTLNALLERIGFAGETVHGFRSVFSTHFNAAEGVNPDVVERCLAHAPRDKIRAVYNRHQYKDERHAMMQEWADWLDGQLAAA